jgi:hypothetical protein
VSEEIVNALLEDEGQKPLDPKYFAARVPTVYDEAIASAKAEFMQALEDGRIHDAKSADEISSELATDACAEFGMDDNDDYEEVVTELFKLAAEHFPGNW